MSLQKGLRAADKSCEAPPNLRQASHQQPCLFALRLYSATPFPRKSRPRLDEKGLPQSTSQLQPQSLTRLTILCLFVEASLSNVCAKRTLRTNHAVKSGIYSVNRGMPAANCHLIFGASQTICNCSIHEPAIFALKHFSRVRDQAKGCCINRASSYCCASPCDQKLSGWNGRR